MRAVIQRATSGEVRVDGTVVGRLAFDRLDERPEPGRAGAPRGRTPPPARRLSLSSTRSSPTCEAGACTSKPASSGR